MVGADDLDVKYTVYNGKKLLRKKIFNFLEHESRYGKFNKCYLQYG